MKLFTFCQGCREEIDVKSSASTRSDLERDRGMNLTIKCPECGKIDSYHLNDVKATVSARNIIAGVVLGIVLTGLLGVVLGGLSMVSMGVAILIWKNEEKKASHFNRYMLPRE